MYISVFPIETLPKDLQFYKPNHDSLLKFNSVEVRSPIQNWLANQPGWGTACLPLQKVNFVHW